LNKERLQGLGKNIKALWYGPFEVLENLGDNLYEPSMLDQEEEKVLPSIEDLASYF
jgi:hypothetical protein